MVVGLIILALVLLVVGLAATKSDTFRNERSAVIQAPPERVFALVNDFHQWGVWSPWEKLDPAMQRTFGGPPSGTGATYAWSGNKKAGAGRMEITASEPSSLIRIALDFLKPIEAHNTAEFVFAPEAGGTRVTWAMSGPRPFMMKVFCVFVDLDKLVGKDFEQGLANMKAAAER